MTEILSQNSTEVKTPDDIQELLEGSGKPKDKLKKSNPLIGPIVEAIGHARHLADYSDAPIKLPDGLIKRIRVAVKNDPEGLKQIQAAMEKDKWDKEHIKFFMQMFSGEGAPVFLPHTLHNLLTMPPKRWIIENLLGKGDIAMIYGGPGCGKTFIVVDMLFAASLAKIFAMRFAVPEPLNVAYCAGEGISGLPARFAAAAQHYGVSDLPNFTFYPAVPQLYGDSYVSPDEITAEASMARFVEEWQARQGRGEAQPLDILFVDTLHSATAGADENSAQDMGKVLQAAKAAAVALDCAVFLVHHTNKNGSAERGSSALRGAMDCMIEIKRIGETGTKAVMSCAKLKDGQAWTPQTFDLVAMADSVRVWWDEPGDVGSGNTKQDKDINAIVSLLRASPGQRYTANRVAEAIGMGASKQIFKLLSKAAEVDDRIKHELQYPGKDASSRNPMMYWLDLQSVISQ